MKFQKQEMEREEESRKLSTSSQREALGGKVLMFGMNSAWAPFPGGGQVEGGGGGCSQKILHTAVIFGCKETATAQSTENRAAPGSDGTSDGNLFCARSDLPGRTSESNRWWQCGPGWCDLLVHLQSPACLLSEIPGWGFQEGDPYPVWPDPAGSRSPALNSKSLAVLVPMLKTRNPAYKPIMRIRVSYLYNKSQRTERLKHNNLTLY